MTHTNIYYLSVCKLQYISLNEMAPTTNLLPLMSFVSILGLNTVITGCISLLPKKKRLMEITCIVDAIFDSGYLLFNLYIRWGVVVDTGGDMISTSFFLVPIYGMFSRLSAFSYIRKLKRVTQIVAVVRRPAMVADKQRALATLLRQCGERPWK